MLLQRQTITSTLNFMTKAGHYVQSAASVCDLQIIWTTCWITTHRWRSLQQQETMLCKVWACSRSNHRGGCTVLGGLINDWSNRRLWKHVEKAARENKIPANAVCQRCHPSPRQTKGQSILRDKSRTDRGESTVKTSSEKNGKDLSVVDPWVHWIHCPGSSLWPNLLLYVRAFSHHWVKGEF